MPAGCRLCGGRDVEIILDLGRQPAAAAFPTAADLEREDPTWPLTVGVCRACWLMQLVGDDHPEESSVTDPVGPSSATMRAHGLGLVNAAARRLTAGDGPIFEVASHGGYLQPSFRQVGIETTILEPQSEVAARASDAGLAVRVTAFSNPAIGRLVADRGPARLVVDSYLLAHLAHPRELIAAIRLMLAPDGIAILEFDHARPMLETRRFDSIRHGHFSYLSLRALEPVLAAHDLAVIDAEETPAFGGSLRLVVARRDGVAPASERVERVREAERAASIDAITAYRAFALGVRRLADDLRAALFGFRADGRSIVAYGAPSRGSTLLNTCGVDASVVPFTVDASPLKQGRFMPGSHLPIFAPEAIAEMRPDFVLILSWDIADEIVSQLSSIREWGGRFVIPMPVLHILE